MAERSAAAAAGAGANEGNSLALSGGCVRKAIIQNANFV